MLTTELLTALADERITFGDFAGQTKGDFTAMATTVARKWGTLPPALQVEDLAQEMLLAVYTTLPSFDKARSDIRSYVIFSMCTAARRELHRHTTSKRRDERTTFMEVQQPHQEESQLAHQLLSSLPEGDRQRAIINSLSRTGSLDLTTAELLADPTTRVLFHDTDPKPARYSVYRTARVLAQRAQATA